VAINDRAAMLSWERRRPVSECVGSVTESAGAILHKSATYYSDGKRRVISCNDLTTPGDLGLYSATMYDELGRVNITQTLESGNPNGTGTCNDAAPAGVLTGGILTDNRYLYGSGARYKLNSNPYRSTGESTMGWTLTTMDTLGRVTAITSYDGATPPSPWGSNGTVDGNTTTAYSANSTNEIHTVYDQVETRTLSLDGLGRTTSVAEAGTTTSYTYDAIGNLDSVTQSGVAPLSGQSDVTQTCPSAESRCFAYDSQSRLSWATNPESGTVSYSYDANGNLTSKLDARGITTTLTYDQLSRLSTKRYSNGTPTQATYIYGTATSTCPLSLGTSYAIGRLISVSNSVSSYAYDCYDGLGRILHGSQNDQLAELPVHLRV
jgi:YD repeat-containing protein